jgi:hypothetical protein
MHVLSCDGWLSQDARSERVRREDIRIANLACASDNEYPGAYDGRNPSSIVRTLPARGARNVREPYVGAHLREN